MSNIKAISAREILDSRGNPTVQVELETKEGVFSAMVPSGASTGIHEALELRDGDKRYNGKGVQTAVYNINKLIARKLVGKNVKFQDKLDNIMIKLDGTKNKSKLGANAILAVSMAICKAGAAAKKMKLYEHIADIGENKNLILPVPMCNVINGGKHAGQENDIQEHMIMPVGAASFSEGIRMVSEVYVELKKLLKKKIGAGSTLIGDEGGFAPPQIKNVKDRLKIMLEAVKKAGYEKEVVIAIDSASSEFYKNGVYTVGTKKMKSTDMVKFYADLVKSFPIVSLEDGFSEDDWEGWVELTAKLGDKIQIMGDDLTVTNVERLQKAIDMKAINSILIKINQIGSISETINAINLAKKHDMNSIVSHRSAETEDTFIADFVVGMGTGQCKFGAPARSERTSKYNRLLRIEEELRKKGSYAGRDFRKIK